MSNDVIAAPFRGLEVPPSDSCCELSIINTTCDIVCPTTSAVEPKIPGYDWLNLPTFSFYMKNKNTGRQILFDLGMRKDWQNAVPRIRDTVSVAVNGLYIKQNVEEILVQGQVDLNKIDAFVMSHWHLGSLWRSFETAKIRQNHHGPGLSGCVSARLAGERGITFPRG